MSFKMNYQQLEETNDFESYINNTELKNIYCFSPKIYEAFDETKKNINELPKYALVYIGNDSFASCVYFYRCSKNIVYIFLIGMDGIQEHYLLD